jgi:hypothetical protein
MKLRILLSIILLSLSACTTNPTLTQQATVNPTVTPMLFPLSTITQTPHQIPTKSAKPTPDFKKLSAIFSYDASVPLDVTWGAEYSKGDAKVQEVSYQGTKSCRAGAIIVTPDGDGSFPAVIYLHRVPANKNQFIDEAVELAGYGVISLLLDSPFDLHCYVQTDYSRQGYIETVIFILRGIDFLYSLPQVDRTRLAFVGHSFGANWGGVVAGIDLRIHSFVLMAGVADISYYTSPVIRDMDANYYISHADNDVFLFQFGTFDEYISKDEGYNYFNVTSGLKSILWYDTDHQGVQNVGQADRVAFLLRQLRVENK